ncbi:MAG: GGDEF domain-containing protein [Burkholderiales bacterium]|nr:GGDEF domain-containing protein [Burkholderiales bacterium]MDE1927373.1 GGDEF domain-containing protein [Burkholderiales bacterium]MDE2160476.1 GGDEF domain-containing protein [Burkholderiales bacterium]MDE2503111.1 GGDEF domain-containing protein [Burkholderiales bacterium]
MSRVVEHLAELTGFRDRDLLDATIVSAFRELLPPAVIAIYRSVGMAPEQHWLMRARMGPGDVAPVSDPLWSDLSTLPRLDSDHDRLACLSCDETLIVPGLPSRAYFALSTENETYGVLEIETDEPLADDMRRQVETVLKVYRNFHRLLDYSERDTLTGLLNRKTFDDSFMRVVASPYLDRVPDRRHEDGSGTWLAVIDIDHFKRVNDGFGHLIGDEVLLLMSRLMRSSFRFQDQIYRFGGEEFVVLMRCENAGAAFAAFERMRANVERTTFPQVGRLTISIGITEVRPSDTPSSAFERADKAVYHAKQSGRNQVHDYQALIEAGKLVDASRDSEVVLF